MFLAYHNCFAPPCEASWSYMEAKSEIISQPFSIYSQVHQFCLLKMNIL